MNFFIIILGICALIIYFYFVLIALINDYKNMYSHKNRLTNPQTNVIIMRIDTFKNYF